ncbi:hypothetical protein BO86DRAFT_351511 [Aspergillus japonicus CBS 114.51]|uniref:Zn(2)-C6 fungal-type domain-containing protein n=1 Tax=Aspergillus japonicus CBS 114.51 TaxID=1448312 RepID=A0A8T8XH49_ASPJA|nr:hypothetical protein BO86DRAFT_351511 [Aspergillus japonicus CBS 114.51]RAH87586.1 hypothetical protein BO86DRAFT_351511 [Aspergillus japonicus CBS 114.51]
MIFISCPFQTSIADLLATILKMAHQAATGKPVRLATSCTECQRRKQKCSRDWPCNHCQARRVAHLCKFPLKKSLKVTRSMTNNASIDTSQTASVESNPEVSSSSTITTITNDNAFRMLGYLPDSEVATPQGAERYQSAAISPGPCGTIQPEMEKAIRIVPPKPYTDILVQHFLSEINPQYYCLYPPTFSHDYATWWSGKAAGQALTPEFTCLLLHICACASLYLDFDARQKLETELGESAQNMAEQYHHTAKQLSSTIAPGKGGLTQVQQLFLNAVYYKSEAQFVESWHALGAAIHQAQELGMHKSSAKAIVSEFEREMRRRIWCILYTWDWQMSLLLSRPFIINSNYCSFEVPNLRLESPDPEEFGLSPIAHMTFQCQLGQIISKIPGVMGGLLSPAQAITIQHETEKWFHTLPAPYRSENPDTRWDQSHKHVAMHRHQLHAIGYMVIFLPLKPCLTMAVDQDQPSIERSLQPTAVDCALKLLESSQRMLAFMLPANAKFHYAPFIIFDTAAFLCSAIIHDHNSTLPGRDKMIEAISTALEALEQISENTKTGAICYAVLKRLASSMNLTEEEKAAIFSRSSDGSLEGPSTPPSASLESSAYLDATSASTDLDLPWSSIEAGINYSTPLGLSPSAAGTGDFAGMDGLSSIDMCELGQIWDWGNLDLNLQWPPAT